MAHSHGDCKKIIAGSKTVALSVHQVRNELLAIDTENHHTIDDFFVNIVPWVFTNCVLRRHGTLETLGVILYRPGVIAALLYREALRRVSAEHVANQVPKAR